MKRNESEYKEECRFYDKERKKCTALKELYCDKEERLCAFFKKKGAWVNED